MKNNEDYRNSIDQKAEKIVCKRRQRNRFISSATSAAACIALIVCAITVVPNLMNDNTAAENPGSNYVNAADSQGKNTTPPTTDTIKTININDILEMAGRAKLYFDPEKTYQETWDWNQIVSYLGKDITPAYITDGLKANTKLNEQSVIFNNDGTIAYDAIWLEYYTEYADDGSQAIWEGSTGIRIVASKLGYSKDCGVYVWASEKESLMGGVSVKLGAIDDLSYVAEFTNAGIQYQVVSSNMSESEFIKMVDALIQQ